MPSSYVAPCTAACLFVARLVELRLRQSPKRGAIVCPQSVRAMVVGGSAVIAAGFAEYFIRQPPFHPAVFFTGLCLALAGFGLRAQAAQALGDLWSVHIEIRTEHPVVRTGPYRRIRHPIYVSLLLEVLGGAIILSSVSALVTFALIYAPVVFWRLRVEEKAMVEHIGDPYRRYMKEVPSLFPSPWGKR